MSFSTFVKNELKQLATKEKDIEYKKIWHTVHAFKKLVANKIGTKTVDDD